MLNKRVNWGALTALVKDDPAVLSEVNSFKSKLEDGRKFIDSVPDKIPTVNWQAYTETVQEEHLKDLKAFDKANPVQEVKVSAEDLATDKKMWAEQVTGIQKLEDYHRLRIRELEIEKAKIEWEKKNLAELDIDEVFKKFPHWEQRIEAEIDEGIWHDHRA